MCFIVTELVTTAYDEYRLAVFLYCLHAESGAGGSAE